MSTTTKALLALFGVTVVTAGGYSVFHFGSWEVKKSTHAGWKWRVVRNRGDFTTYAARPGFAETEVGKYPSKPQAMEAAIKYIEDKAAPAASVSDTAPSLSAHTIVAKPAQAQYVPPGG